MSDDHAGRDLEDARLIEAGDYARVLERHRALIRRRVGMYLRGADADDVTSSVVLYLYTQLERGRRFDAPFRVVAWKRAGWMAIEFAKDRRDVPVEDPESWQHGAAGDGDDVDDWGYVRSLLAQLAPRDREVFELAVYGGLTPAEIASRVGIDRNAVDQAMHRARRTLRTLIDG